MSFSDDNYAECPNCRLPCGHGVNGGLAFHNGGNCPFVLWTYAKQIERERAQHAKISGREADPVRSPAQQTAFQLLLGMTEAERSLVLCWFCGGCYRHVPPGDTCHCENDE